MITIEDAIKSTDTVIGISLLFVALITFIGLIYIEAYKRNLKKETLKLIDAAVKEERANCQIQVLNNGSKWFAKWYDVKAERDQLKARLTASERENDRLSRLLEAKDKERKYGR